MKSQSSIVRKHWFLFLVLLIEGSALMAVELIGAKLIAPFYGNSLYVWTAVLGITVLALTAGYYIGGVLSEKRPEKSTLVIIITVSAILVLALPHSSGLFMTITSGMNLKLGIIVTCLGFLLPPLICFGMVGPLVVRLMSVHTQSLGKIAGTVYFTSTSGGIASTFLFGFYMIPFEGMTFSAYYTATALFVLPVIWIITRLLSNKSENENGK